MIDIPDNFRLDSIRVFTKDNDYDIEITEGFIKTPLTNRNFIENCKTNNCMKLCYCLNGQSQSLPIESHNCIKVIML